MAAILHYSNVSLRGNGIIGIPLGWADRAKVLGNEESILLAWGLFGKRKMLLSEITSVEYKKVSQFAWPYTILTITYRNGGKTENVDIKVSGRGAMFFDRPKFGNISLGHGRRGYATFGLSFKEGELDFKSYFAKYTKLSGQEINDDDRTELEQRNEMAGPSFGRGISIGGVIYFGLLYLLNWLGWLNSWSVWPVVISLPVCVFVGIKLAELMEKRMQ